jgi:hypothetical protein
LDKIVDEQPEMKAESDKAWDAMHCALTDGRITWDNCFNPLNHVVLGDEFHYEE